MEQHASIDFYVFKYSCSTTVLLDITITPEILNKSQTMSLSLLKKTALLNANFV